jgi:lipoprotein NlpD
MAAGCASGPGPTARTYVVQPHDTLYSIAWRHDIDYRDLARWNHLGADYRISVGQVLALAPDGHRAPAAPVRAPNRASAANAGSPGGPPRPPVPPAPSLSTRPGQSCESAGQSWLWPTAHGSPPRPVPGGGILLLGTLGQSIRAACPGKVVYAGSGIRGYGNLIIIKHGETQLSAYAHTIDLTVHEGEEVAAGQQIARMGSGPHDIAALYFEIRVNGKPVDPVPLLPPE